MSEFQNKIYCNNMKKMLTVDKIKQFTEIGHINGTHGTQCPRFTNSMPYNGHTPPDGWTDSINYKSPEYCCMYYTNKVNVLDFDGMKCGCGRKFKHKYKLNKDGVMIPRCPDCDTYDTQNKILLKKFKTFINNKKLPWYKSRNKRTPHALCTISGLEELKKNPKLKFGGVECMDLLNGLAAWMQ